MSEVMICQSCGMPMNDEKLYGTEKDGSKNLDYCKYCYKNGEFTQPNITVEEMIQHNVKYLDEFNKHSEVKYTPEQAIEEMSKFFPTLKRWKEKK